MIDTPISQTLTTTDGRIFQIQALQVLQCPWACDVAYKVYLDTVQYGESRDLLSFIYFFHHGFTQQNEMSDTSYAIALYSEAQVLVWHESNRVWPGWSTEPIVRHFGDNRPAELRRAG